MGQTTAVAIDKDAASGDSVSTYPGQALGLPPTGAGSLARWSQRVTALVIDWAAAMLVAQGIGLVTDLRSNSHQAWLTMAVFFASKTVLTWLMGCSFGQAITGVRVVRCDGGRLGLVRYAARTGLICLVIPAVVVGPDRRGLDDVILDSVAVSTR